MQLGVEHPLEYLPEIGLILFWFDGKDLLPYLPFLEELNRKVVEVDLETVMPVWLSRFLIAS